MRTFIVLIPVDYSNSRKVCELIENQKFESIVEASDYIVDKLGEENDSVLYFPLTDFMDEVNNQTLDNLTEYFISYIILTN